MKPYAGAVNRTVRWFFSLFCHLDTAALDKVPMHGPLILVANHVNFLDAPVIRSSLHPREVIGLAKVETYRNPLFKFLFSVWGSVPIVRGTVDRAALQACVDVLAEGKILAVAPEGTRSGNGKLQEGKAGIVPLAVRSGAPLLPMVCWGAEGFWENMKHLRRTPFHICVGRPFLVDLQGEGLSRDVRQRVTDEIMFKLAELLPEKYQGVYARPEEQVFRYLREAL